MPAGIGRFMKIAMVSEHASPLVPVGDVDAGGQNIHVAALSAALTRRGHDVVVYTRRDDRELPVQVESVDGYLVRHIDAGPPERLPKDALLEHMPVFGQQLVAWWARDLPDVAHAHFWMSGLASNRAGRATGVPIVQTFHALGVVKRRHQGVADTSPALRIATELMLCRQVARVIATCSDEVRELRQFGLEGDRVDVVPCGVDVAEFTPWAELDEPHRQRRILTVSRLVPRKGVDDVIRALVDVPDAELLIAGGPATQTMNADPEVIRLRALADTIGVAERVRFLGAVSRTRMPALMRSADVMVSVPWYEPFGIAPVEAAACGVPVIASAVGGMLDTVLDEVTGLHVPPRDPAALAIAINRMLDDDAMRVRLGRAAADRAHRMYSWDRVAELSEHSYKRVLAEMDQLAFDGVPASSAFRR